MVNDVERDWCYMTFVTHNINLTQDLEEYFKAYHRQRRDVQHKYEVVTKITSFQELTDTLPMLHARFEQSLNSLKREIETIQKNPDNYSSSSLSDNVTSYGYRLHDQSSCFGELLGFSKTELENDRKSQKLLAMLETLHTNYSHHLEDIVDLKRQLEQKTVDDEDLILDKYRELCGMEDELDRFLRRLMLNLQHLSDDSSHTDYPKYQARYNSNHPLTIIVSHPGGRSQQISLGEVTDRKSLWYDHHSMYRYTNKTCQGCEGARVFILGRTGISDHSHSGEVGKEGESGAWSDIIPYIVSLSAIPQGRN